MTGRHNLDRELGMYLHERATSQAPDGLLAVTLGQIGATRQRPGWLVPERWFSPQATNRMATVMRGSARLALAALLIAVAVAAILIVGSQRRLPSPFGLARPGLIVYDWDGHLFVMNADGTGRRQLTSGPSSDSHPTWSPDGTLIAYKSESSDRSDAVIVVSADGQRHVTIADRLAPSDPGQISWAPDSRRLAFSGTLAAAGDPLSDSHIYVAEADRPGAAKIGAGFDPAWSPDGQQIAFRSLFPVDALWLMDADGSQRRQLTKVPGSGFAFWNPQWSPDGTRLLYLGGDDGAHEVWTINADASDERNVSRSPEDEGWPSWSPDGAKIAFVRILRDSPRRGSFVVVNPDGSDPVTLSGTAYDANLPIWSPDATKLFAVDTNGYPQHAVVLYDVLGKTPPLVLEAADDGTWQRLAN